MGASPVKDAALFDGPLTTEQIEAVVTSWTRDAEREADALLRPVSALVTSGNVAAALEAMRVLLTEQSLEMRRLRTRDALSTRLRFGKKSEKVSAEQTALDFVAFGGELDADGSVPSDAVVPTPDASATEFDETTTNDETPETQTSPNEDAPKRKGGGGGRRAFPANLPRVENRITVPDAERPCTICGAMRACIGSVEHVRLEYVPARLEVHVEVRETLACLPCRKDVSVAPREAAPRKVRGAPSLLAEMLILKCDDALPIHRVREQLERIGLDLASSTIGRWWDYVTALLGPVADVMLGRILASDYIGVDDTGLLFLDPQKESTKRPAKKGHLWCFTSQDNLVGYRFTRSWEAQEIAQHLMLADGFVQGDGYAGYASAIDVTGGSRVLVPPERRLGCMMHARRPFHELIIAKDGRALVPIDLFRKIYALEADYKRRGLDPEARGRERCEKSLPLFDKLATWVASVHGRLRPKDPLAKATTYFTNQLPYLRRCFEDGRFEIDTGRVERAIREVAIGRKNFILTGSADAGVRLASAYTVVESARRVIGTTRVREYLIDVITRLEGGYHLDELHQLVPDVWLANHPA